MTAEGNSLLDGPVHTFKRRKTTKSQPPPQPSAAPRLETAQQEACPVLKRSPNQSLLEAADPQHAAKRVRRNSAPAAAPRKFTQTHLDLGQRNFFSTRCPTCGLVYTPGKPEDDKLHAEYHKGPAVPRYSHSRGDLEVATDGTAGTIVRVPSSALSKSLRDLTAVMEDQLGLLPGWLLAVPCTAILYVCASTRNILGCIVTENIKQAWSATASNCNDSNDGMATTSAAEEHQPGSSSGIVLADTKSVKKAVCGVRMMWTSPAARRQGIATKLLDCARSQLARGCILPRGDLAFSQPTTEGAAFIQAYVESSNFLVYSAQQSDPLDASVK